MHCSLLNCTTGQHSTRQLFISFLKSSLLSGASFQQVSEQIANNNYESFARRVNHCFLKDKIINSNTNNNLHEQLPNFLVNILFSLPSSDKLINLFLGEYNSQITYYQNAVDTKKQNSVCPLITPSRLENTLDALMTLKNFSISLANFHCSE